MLTPRLFLRCYRRPDAHDSASYKIPFAFDDDPRFASISNKAAELAKTLMAALYRIPCKPVISFDENPAVSEEAVLAIWGQQWARLRRSFRFCTLALSDRSTKDSTFDLQLIPAAMPSAKSRFNGAVEAHKTDREPDWLCVAVDELTTPRPDGLRQFLFQAGSDLQDGRSSFANLCRIFGILERNGGVRTDVETALKLIPEPTDASSARALKGMVARKLFAQKAFSSGEALTYIVEHLDLLDIWSSNGSYVDFGHSLLRDQPRVFAKLAGTDDQGGLIFKETLASAPIKDILKAVLKVPGLLRSALESRSALLYEPEIWSAVDAHDTKILDELNGLDDLRKALSAAMIADRLDLSRALRRCSSEVDLIVALHRAHLAASLDMSVLHKWIDAVGSPKAIESFLLSEPKLDCHFLLALSQKFAPDEIPRGPKRDPWLSALDKGHGKLNDEDKIYFRAYLLARALGNTSNNSAELTLYGFQKTDEAAAASRLSYSSWGQLERRLPWPMFWQDWDKCYRLRKGVAEKCLEENWSSNVFINLTREDEVFAILVAFVDHSYRGRQYLREIKDRLKRSSDPLARRRRAIIKHIMNDN